MFTDTLTLDRGSLQLTDAGYLHVNARVARIGSQTYLGSEVGIADKATVEVHRPESEVFATDSLQSFASIPITIDHPAEPVTSENWGDFAVGNAGDEILREGDFIKIGLRITDAAAIKAIQDGKRELSVGYSAQLVDRDGELTQTKIRANHIALVDRARAGSQARIGDDANTPTKKEIKAMSLKTVLVDGLSVETTDAGAQAIEKLQADLKDGRDREAQLVSDHEATIKKLEDAKASAEAERDTLKDAANAAAKVAEAEALKALVADAGKLSPSLKFDGMDAEQVYQAVCADKGIDVAGKPLAYVQGRFEGLKDSAVDPVGKAKVSDSSISTARQDYLDRIVNASKGE